MIQNCIINEKWLKEFSPIPLNYDMKEIHNYVKLAEQIWLIDIIGQDFYDELIDQVAENNLTEANSTALVEAIYPYLAFAVAYESLPTIWAHISEVGVTLGKSEFAESATLKDMSYVQQHLRNQVEARKSFCKKWLCERNDKFPLLDCCACGCSCCKEDAKFIKPNPQKIIHSTPRRCTDLK